MPGLIFAAVLLLLGLNKPLNLQTLFLQAGRKIAVAAGWYGECRLQQMVFVLVLRAVGLGDLLTLIWIQRGFFQQHPLSLTVCVLLIFHALFRAAAIDHVDETAGLQLDDRHWMVGMELAGVPCLVAAGVRAANSPP